jgi:hypothetical protein
MPKKLAITISGAVSLASYEAGVLSWRNNQLQTKLWLKTYRA